jgi:hypothetical protein
MRIWWLAIVACACGGKKAGSEWASRPLEQVSDKVGDDAVGMLTYTISIPKGLAPDPILSGGITRGYEVAHDFKAPSVLIGFDAIPPKSVDEAVKESDPEPGDEIVRKDAIDHGFIVTTRAKSHRHWKVDVVKLAGERGVGCMAQQANDDDELGSDTKELLEKICLSLTVK